MTEGSPFRTVLAGGTGGLTGAAAVSAFLGGFLDLAGHLTTPVQIVVVVAMSLIIITAEVGVILIVVQYLRSASSVARRPGRARRAGESREPSSAVE